MGKVGDCVVQDFRDHVGEFLGLTQQHGRIPGKESEVGADHVVHKFGPFHIANGFRLVRMICEVEGEQIMLHLVQRDQRGKGVAAGLLDRGEFSYWSSPVNGV